MRSATIYLTDIKSNHRSEFKAFFCTERDESYKGYAWFVIILPHYDTPTIRLESDQTIVIDEYLTQKRLKELRSI
jgi:hypothetical protein